MVNIYLDRFENKLQEDLLRLCTSYRMLDGVLLSSEDIDMHWNKLAPEYMADAVPQIADYPTVSVAWAAYLGLAIAYGWDKDWTKCQEATYQSYYGSQGLVCLCAPNSVVAVPERSDYGKLRTCAYLPINVVEYDNDGRIKDADIDTGFEWDFLQQICYSGEVATNDDYHYSITIPETPEFNREKIIDNLYELALSYGRK